MDTQTPVRLESRTPVPVDTIEKYSRSNEDVQRL